MNELDPNTDPSLSDRDTPPASYLYQIAEAGKLTSITHSPTKSAASSLQGSFAEYRNQPSYYQPATHGNSRSSQSIDAAILEYARNSRYPPIAQAPDRRDSAVEQRKREVKRRTKTGCLTCRKRRVKCDEAQPACRNCSKTRRDCAYDPIFITSPGPRSIRSAASSGSRPITPAAPRGSPSEKAYTPEIQDSPARSQDKVDVESGSTRRNRFVSQYTAIDSASTGSDRMADQPSNFESTASERPQLPETASSRTVIKPTKTTLSIEELYHIGGVDPPTPKVTIPIPTSTIDEIKFLYTQEYARGIDTFLETSWYCPHGLDILLADEPLMSMFASMTELFTATQSDNYDTMRLLPSTEARMVWRLMCLPRNVSDKSMASPDLRAVLDRVRVFESLITGVPNTANPLAHASPVSSTPSDAQGRQTSFWHHLGQFSACDMKTTAGLAGSERALRALRQLLDEIENRDVLYSIAIARQLFSREGGGALSEADRQKQGIARSFLQDEAAGKGTTQVVQRVCGMAMRGLRGLPSST